jgi:DNA-binding NarL/FixJ family response regulator
MLEAAYNLAEGQPATLEAIAKAATEIIPRGPVVVCTYDPVAALPDVHGSHFARADERWVRAFNDLSRTLPVVVRRTVLSIAPHAFGARASQDALALSLPEKLREKARNMPAVVIMANTGDGDALSVGFGHQPTGEWPAARIRQLRPIAQHLAAAWRLRTAMTVATAATAPVVAELHVDGTPAHLTPSTSSSSAQDALRRGVLARERARAGRRGTDERALWPALVAGRWSLLDAFTAAGTRYIVAHENPPEATMLRALTPREQLVLEHVLAGRTGKWIALELGVSEPTVARTIRSAVRRLGVADPAALAELRSTRFESLDGLLADGALAVGRQTFNEGPAAGLTQAERDVVAGLVSGRRMAAIARERGTSPRTVAQQIASIYRKIGVSSRRELLAQPWLTDPT